MTSCNGQTKTQSHTDNKRETKSISTGQPKLVKTQGSNKSDNIHCSLQDKVGNIWFATTGEGAYRYDGELFTQFTKKDGLNSDCVYAILEDKEGNIWFGTENGACRYVGKSITGSKPNGDGWIRYMLKDKNENIWFGGRGHGNFIFNGKIFSNFTERVGIGNPILIDTSGNIWFRGEEKISTVEIDGGIWCYDGKKFKNYSTNDGISKYFV